MKVSVLSLLSFGVLLMICCGRDPKFEQYIVRGEQLYIRHCSNCHQKSGEGLALLYPPLKVSDFVDKEFERTLCVMRHGISGELVVNGKTFNQPMPGIPSLTDLEIAEIATYLYNSGDRKRGLILVTEVEKVMATCTQ